MCGNCHSESRELWAIGPPYPTWKNVASGNFVALGKCAECGQLWLESYYEPFAAFRYAVKWPNDVAKFEAIRDRDQSLTLCKWHEAQVKVLGNGADKQTLSYMRAHYDRARGYVDLMPSRAPNPVNLNDA
jgi:hypothetical protein